LHIVSSAKTHGSHSWLIPAFAISLALHLFLLWSVPDGEPEAGRSASVEATLRPPLLPIASPTSIPPVSSRTKEATPNPMEPALPATTPRSVPLPPTIEPASAPMADSTVNSLIRSDSAPAQPVPEARAAASLTQEAGPVVSADGLRRYRLALAREAGRYKRYPERAIEAGWSGTAELRVKVSPGQSLPVAELTKSSGHAVLDEAALEMLKMAMPTTPIPASLQARAFSVELPIVFELPE
jgi:periplasmic protein TonB